MSKIKVVYVKRVEDRDKAGKKTVIPAGTKDEVTAAQLKALGSKVVQVKDDKPVTAVHVQDDAPPAGGEGEDGEGGEGDEGGGE